MIIVLKLLVEFLITRPNLAPRPYLQRIVIELSPHRPSLRRLTVKRTLLNHLVALYRSQHDIPQRLMPGQSLWHNDQVQKQGISTPSLIILNGSKARSVRDDADEESDSFIASEEDDDFGSSYAKNYSSLISQLGFSRGPTSIDTYVLLNHLSLHSSDIVV